MKPILITLHNIGPFRDETLDFTQLDTMFLIYGNTGAGKTTIFDAMTYALYGTLNGTRKGNVRSFRSDFVSPDEQSYVVYTFELAYATYRVTRTLPQIYTTRNGTPGEKPVTVSLETSTDGKRFTPFSGTAGETNNRIEQIIGLSGTEFSRIVLLPQGAFADFLRENSKERRDTLEKLFPVDAYTAIMEEVKTLSEENAKQLAAVNAQIQHCSEKYDAQTAPGELETLASRRLVLEQAQSELIKKVADISAAAEKLTAAYTAAQQAETNRKRLSVLQSQAEHTNEERQRLSHSTEAAKLAGYIQSAEQCRERVKQSTENAAAAKLDATHTAQELLNLTAQKDTYESLKTAAEEADAILPRQRERLAQIRQLKELKAAAERTAAEEQAADARLKAAEAEAEKTASLLLDTVRAVCPDAAEGTGTANLLTLLSAAEQTARSVLTDAQTGVKNARLRAELTEEISTAEQNAAQAVPAYEEAQQNVENTKKWITELESQRDLQNKNNAACSLAAGLSDGHPCPVCGSLTHPAPAEPLPETLGLETKIATARKNLTLAEANAAVKLQERARTQKHVEELQKQLSEAAPSLPEDEAEANLAHAEQTHASISETAAVCARNADKQQQLEQQIRALSQHFSQVTSEAASARATYEQLVRSVRKTPEETVPDEQSLAADIASLERKSADGKTAYAAWNASFTEAGKRNSSAQTRCEELSAQLSSAVQSAADSENTLMQHLAQSPFKTAAEAQEALLSPAEQNELLQSIEAYDNECKRITALLENAPQSESSSSLSEMLGQTGQELARTKTELEETVRNLQDVNTSYTTLQTYIAESSGLEAERVELEKKSAPAKKLFADLSGTNPKKIPFNSWALGIYFERIVEYANSRFFTISGGRFMFKLASDRNQGGGYKGLDLVVSDTFTGTDRDTATLSGGETFMASISLALALTDIVQSRNGGVHLDSLFIDEGFGSLDEETLDCAVTVLTNLQDTKMVGIISHVESMKTAVPSQVEIVKTAEGSHIIIR